MKNALKSITGRKMRKDSFEFNHDSDKNDRLEPMVVLHK